MYPYLSDVSLPAELQGGPHNHQIGALAVQLLEVDSPMFKDGWTDGRMGPLARFSSFRFVSFHDVLFHSDRIHQEYAKQVRGLVVFS